MVTQIALVLRRRMSRFAGTIAATPMPAPAASLIGGMKPRARKGAIAVFCIIAVVGFVYIACFYTFGPIIRALMRK